MALSDWFSPHLNTLENLKLECELLKNYFYLFNLIKNICIMYVHKLFEY